MIPQDVRRPLDSFAHNIEHETLLEDVRTVVTTEEPFEKDVRDRRGNWYQLRALPYRSKARVNGVVITLVDEFVQTRPITASGWSR